MIFGQALRELVLDQAGIATLIGDRLYPLVFPQASARPAATYRVISGPRDYTQDGPDGVTRFRVQFDFAAETYADCEALASAFETALSGKHGANIVYGGSPPAVKFHGLFIDNEQDFYESALDTEGPKEWRKSVDYFVTASLA